MTDGEPLRVVIAEDSVLMREGIASLLEGAGFEIVGKSSTADDLLLKVRSYKPHVAIVDIRMPPNHTDEGLVAAKEIREQHPEVGVLVLSQYVEPSYAMELIADDAEGVGYLLKDRIPDVDEFRSSVRRVAEGGSALDPAIVTQLVGRRRSDDPTSVDGVSSSTHFQKRARSPSGRGCGGRNGPSSMPSIAAAWSRAMRNAPKSMLSMWWSIDRATSRGSRPTQMYVTVGSLGIPSSGVWVLMKRRCVCASRSANTSVRERVTMSIHGESVSNGSGSSGSCRISSAQIICVHVVPHFGGVLMMMSPGRSSKPSQRLLS